MIFLNLISSIIKNFFLFLIRIYQLILSPFFGRQCRFTPTCSNYAQEAIEIHGVLRGFLLTLKRLLKCHPWGKFGHDSVPKI